MAKISCESKESMSPLSGDMVISDSLFSTRKRHPLASQQIPRKACKADFSLGTSVRDGRRPEWISVWSSALAPAPGDTCPKKCTQSLLHRHLCPISGPKRSPHHGTLAPLEEIVPILAAHQICPPGYVWLNVAPDRLNQAR